MTKKADLPVPSLWADYLVPADAIGVPEPILAASEALRVAGLAAFDARIRSSTADRAARQAPQVDRNAAVPAVRDGQDPPATVAAKRHEAEIAGRAAKAANAIAERAAADLEVAIREHRGEWFEAERAEAVKCQRAALDVVDVLAASLERLSGSASRLTTLSESGQHKAVGRGRRFTPHAIGFNSHDGTAGVPASAMLTDLREAIATAVPELIEAEQRDRDELAA